MLRFSLTMISVGPIVSFTPATLSFGEVAVIADHTKELTLANESDIPAPFRLYTKRKDTVFKAEVMEAVIEPGESYVLRVHAFLRDAQKCVCVCVCAYVLLSVFFFFLSFFIFYFLLLECVCVCGYVCMDGYVCVLFTNDVCMDGCITIFISISFLFLFGSV